MLTVILENYPVLSITLPLLVIAIFFFYLTNKIKNLNNKIQTLEQENHDLANQPTNNNKQVIEFLQKQKDISKEHFKNTSGKSQFQFSLTDPVEHQAILLRAYYLKAEQLALKWIDDNEKYWLSLTKNLAQIFSNLGIEKQQAQLQQKQKEIKVLEKKLEMGAPDDSLSPISNQALISSALDNINEIHKSINTTTRTNQDKQNMINQLSSISFDSADYDLNVNHLKSAVNFSEGEIVALREKVKALTNEIEFLKNIKTNSDSDNDDLSIEAELIRNNASKLIDKTSKQSVINQMDQLRESNEQQRNFIVKLRKNINDLENEVSNKPDLSEHDLQQKLLEIEQLEKMVAEFEHCVYSLESEVELLHQQLEILGTQHLNNTNAVDSANSTKTEQELAQLKELFESTMQMYSDQSALTEFAMEAAKCDKIIELLVVLNNCFRAFEVTAAFHIRTEIAHNKSIPSGFLSPKEEALLTQESRPKNGLQFKIGNKMYFWNSHISFIIGDFPQSEERKTQIIDNIAVLKNIISSEIIRIESALSNQRQHKTILRLLSATQKELADIDIHQKYQSMEYKNIIQSICSQADQIKELPNITEETIFLIDNLKKESEIRTDILESTGTLVSSGFTNLIESLNKKLTKENVN